jgi:hypothetical protein
MTYTSATDASIIDNRIVIYPNPTKDEFHISFKSNFPNVTTIEVFDLRANKIGLTETVNDVTQPYTLNCKNWSNGIYYLKIITDNAVSIKKIVKY